MAPIQRRSSRIPRYSRAFSTTPYSRMLWGSRQISDMGILFSPAASAPTVLP